MSGGLEIRRWRRFGNDRTYVRTAAGESLGWRDNVTGQIHPVDEADRALIEAFLASREPAPVRAVVTDLPPAAPPPVPGPPTADVDLARNAAGQAARQKAVELKSAAPIRTVIARVLGIHTEERAWRIGAKGEQMVAAQLARLGPDWHAIHAIPVGVNGADIDHLVIGPGGVFSLNAKHHPGAKIWVAGNTFMVNGSRVPYVRNSRHEAKRASRILSGALGRTIAVAGIIVPVGAADVVIKQSPEDVHVVPRMQIARWLSSQPNRLDPAAVSDVVRAARHSATWQQAA